MATNPTELTTRITRSKRFEGTTLHQIDDQVAVFCMCTPECRYVRLLSEGMGDDILGMPTSFVGYLTYTEDVPIENEGEQLALALPA